MLKTITIPVDPPITGHAVVRQVVVQEPDVMTVLSIGDPFSIGMTPSGAQLIAENPDAIQMYVRHCVIEPRDHLVLAQGGVKLAREIKSAILSFFLDGDAAVEASPTSPTTSSLEPAQA